MPVSGGTMGAVAQSYRQGQSTLDAAVVPGVRKLWGTYMDPGKMTDSWENLRGPLGLLIAQSYLASANSGARYYNASRVAAGFPAIKVKLAPSPTPEQIAATTGGTGIGAFLHQIKQGARWMDAYASACDSLAAAVSRLVLSGGRHTVTTMSVADPKCLGWRRITSGTCDYCEALAGEGIAVDAEDFPAHNYCQCQAAPEFGTSTTGGEVPPGEGDGGMGLDLSDIFDMSPEEALAEGIDLEVIGETFAEELVIEDPQWAKVIEFIGNALSSGNLKGVDAYLNADGTVNDGKAILKLLKDYKSPGYKPYPAQPYDLGGNKPLNKTMTKMLDKFFGKGGDQIVEDAKQTVLEKIGIPAPAPKTPGITEDFIKSINQKAALDKLKEAFKLAKEAVGEEAQAAAPEVASEGETIAAEAHAAQEMAGNIKESVKLNLTKAQIREILDDPALHDVAKKWKTGNKAVRSQLSDQIVSALKGQTSGVSHDAKIMANAIRNASEEAPQLYKGLAWNMNDSFDVAEWAKIEPALSQGVGGVIDFGPSSFSDQLKWPLKFQKEMKTGPNVRDMMIRVDGGATATNVEGLGISQGEAEWLAGGKFRITNITKVGNSYTVDVKQIFSLNDISSGTKIASKASETEKGLPVTSALSSVVQSWKGSSVSLSQEISRIIYGNDAGVSARAKTLWKALQKRTIQSPFIRSGTPTLYRGMKWYTMDSRATSFFAEIDKGPGTILDMDPASFSKAFTVAKNFSGGGIKQMVITVKDARGFDIQNIGSSMQSEAELISGGRYKIVSVKQTGSFYDVVMQQIGWYG